MNPSSIYINIARSLLAIGLAIYSISLFPQPAFDVCISNISSFYCDHWHITLPGFTFVLIGYVIGPRNKFYHLVLFCIFVLFGIAENIRSGESLFEILPYLYLNTFYYGGIIAILSVSIFTFILADKQQ